MGSLSHSVLYLHGVLPQHSPSSDFGENQLSRGLISLSLLLSSHLRIFQHPRVRSFIWCYPNFNLLKSRSPPLRVYCPRLGRAIGTRFPFASGAEHLRLAPRTITRRLIMQKASSHRLHSTAVERGWIDGLLDFWITGFQTTNPQIHLSTHPLYSAGGRMEPAPTHCRHMVSGTISLP